MSSEYDDFVRFATDDWLDLYHYVDSYHGKPTWEKVTAQFAKVLGVQESVFIKITKFALEFAVGKGEEKVAALIPGGQLYLTVKGVLDKMNTVGTWITYIVAEATDTMTFYNPYDNEITSHINLLCWSATEKYADWMLYWYHRDRERRFHRFRRGQKDGALGLPRY